MFVRESHMAKKKKMSEPSASKPDKSNKSNKRPPRSKEEKAFVETAKRIFSSLSARACPYAYFNVRPNGLIISNSTSPTPNDVHGDRLMDYKVGELGLHFVEVKDAAFLERMRNFLQLPSDACYCVLGPKVVSILNKFHIKELHVVTTTDKQIYLLPKTSKKLTKDAWVAGPVTDFHVLSALHYWNDFANEIGSPGLESRCHYVRLTLPKYLRVTNRVYFFHFDASLFEEDGVPVLHDKNTNIELMGVDGVSTVSRLEYIGKWDEEYTLELYAWLVAKSYFLTATLYEDSLVRVISTRPNIATILLPASTKVEPFKPIVPEPVS